MERSCNRVSHRRTPGKRDISLSECPYKTSRRHRITERASLQYAIRTGRDALQAGKISLQARQGAFRPGLDNFSCGGDPPVDEDTYADIVAAPERGSNHCFALAQP